ncbi:MAG: copper amine oxidase [bacterium]
MTSRKFLIRITGAVLLLAAGAAQSAEHCSDAYYIDKTLDNGARWDMCWAHKEREGIVLHDVYYTPKEGARKKVFAYAGIAQIHVPYDDDGARYHDVSDYGIGGRYLNNLSAGDCPGGQRIKLGSKNVICMQTNKGYGHAWRDDASGLQGSSLSLFSVSHVGAYNYIPLWEFQDNGTIVPTMGATGRLQRISNQPTHAWDLGNNRYGISHLHNYYWKLDFDLGEDFTDETVEEINLLREGSKRIRSNTVFTTEAKRSVNPETLRTWRIKDGSLNNSKGHPMSWEIQLNESGHKDVGPSFEPWSFNDFYVTRQNNCEIYASHNPSSQCGDNLDAFANGESLNGADKVIWVGLTFHHVPRAEDDPRMNAHWNHFRIIPRDWHAHHPLAPVNVNHPPQVSSPGDQSYTVGDGVNLLISTSDADNDTLSFSAEGLPAGLDINRQSGLISGTVSAAGDHTVTVYVSDGHEAVGTTFNIQVQAAPPVGSTTLSNPNASLTMDGSDADWQALDGFPQDPQEISTAHKIDWLSASMAHSDSTLFIGYRSEGSVSLDDFWAWRTLLDTDSNQSTGYRWGAAGVDYMLEGPALFKYTGNGYDWSWQEVATMNHGVGGGFVEIAVPRQILGNPQGAMAVFFAGMNEHLTAGPNDFYPDGEGANLFTYILSGSQPPDTIQIDGDRGDWANVTSWADADDVSEGNMADWRKVWFTRNGGAAWLAYENDGDIDLDKFWSWQVFLDTDSNAATGYGWGSSGSDYLMEGGVLFRYIGDGSSWDWSEVGPMENQVAGNFVEMKIPESNLGNPTSYRLYFRGANEHFGSTTDELLVTP